MPAFVNTQSSFNSIRIKETLQSDSKVYHDFIKWQLEIGIEHRVRGQRAVLLGTMH